MSDLARNTAITGELIDSRQDCSLRYRQYCTNTDVQLVEDPYEADVNNTPGQLMWACGPCLEQLALDI